MNLQISVSSVTFGSNELALPVRVGFPSLTRWVPQILLFAIANCKALTAFPQTTGCFVIQLRKQKFVFGPGLYINAGIAVNDFMSLGELVIITLGGLLLVIAGFRFAKKFFSEDAKRERRRRRSNAPISTRSNRPAVRFSVRTKKSRRK
jgi:hypothetical protein